VSFNFPNSPICAAESIPRARIERLKWIKRLGNAAPPHENWAR
jgi:hypothetical protein